MSIIAETKRLKLRKFTKSDLDSLAALMGNEEVMKFSINGPMSKDQTKAMLEKGILEKYEKKGYGLLAIVLKEDDTFLGYAGLLDQKIESVDFVELSFRLLPDQWGKGYATEAANAICTYAFADLKIDRLISIIDPQNIRSVKVAKRIGMHFWKDDVFYGIPVRIYLIEKR